MLREIDAATGMVRHLVGIGGAFGAALGLPFGLPCSVLIVQLALASPGTTAVRPSAARQAS